MPSKAPIIATSQITPVPAKSVTIETPGSQIISSTPTPGKTGKILTQKTSQVARPCTPKLIETTEESQIAKMTALGSDFTNYQQTPTISPGLSRFGDVANANCVNRGPTVDKVQAPETATNFRKMFESGQIPDLHEIHKTVPEIEMVAPGSGVFENVPTRNEGVIRGDDVVNDLDVLAGVTKNLVDQFKLVNLGKMNLVRGPINMAEDEGKILENAPTRRTDVYREQETTEQQDVRPVEGTTTDRLTQWINMNTDFIKDDKPIQLIENPNERSVLENEPEVRNDVMREEDVNDEVWMKRGMTRDLTSHWSSIVPVPILARDHGIDMPVNEPTVVLENEPIRLDGVVRESDPNHDHNVTLDGLAKNMTDRWLNIKDERMPKDAFRLEADLGVEGGVYENTPSQVADHVFRSSEAITDVMTKEGVTRLMQNRFIEETPVQGERKQMIQMNLAEGEGVHENQPISLGPDVIRSTDGIQEVMNDGSTKDMVQRWRNLDVESVFGGVNFITSNDPAVLLEAERRFESGVYENNPTFRDDVLRELDYTPEVIEAPTQQLKTTWKTMGLEPARDNTQPRQVRFTPPRELSPSHEGYSQQEIHIVS